RRLLSLRQREPCAESDEQGTERPVEPGHRAAAQSKLTAQARCGPGDQEVPQRSVGVEDGTEQDKGERLVRRIGIDELRQEREKEKRDLRIEHVGEETLRKNLRQRCRRRQRGGYSGRSRQQQLHAEIDELRDADP